MLNCGKWRRCHYVRSRSIKERRNRLLSVRYARYLSVIFNSHEQFAAICIGKGYKRFGNISADACGRPWSFGPGWTFQCRFELIEMAFTTSDGGPDAFFPCKQD